MAPRTQMLPDLLQKRMGETWQGSNKEDILSLRPSREKEEPNWIIMGPKLWPCGIWVWLSFSTASPILNQTQTLDCIKCNYQSNWYWVYSPCENRNPAHTGIKHSFPWMTFQDRKKHYRQDKHLNNKERLWQNSSLHYSVQCSQFSPRSPKARFILLSNHGLSSPYWEVTALDYTLQLQAATHPSNSSSNIINTVVTRGR